MANNETAFRTELVQAFKKVAFVQTIQQRFAAGMPDLLVCWLGDVWFMELKYAKPSDTVSFSRHGSIVPPLIKTTDLQRSWMRRYQDVGGSAAWVIGTQVGPTEWRLYAGIDHRQQRATELDLVTTRRRGVPWDVQTLLDFLSLRREERGK